MVIRFLDKLSLEQIKDQTLQVLNYSLNSLGQDKFNLSSLLSNFSCILHDKVNETFNTSLDNSIDCIIDNSRYLDNIHSLASNNKNSFILAPLLTKGHLFTALVYKKDDLFEFILINKSSGPNNHSYQRYVLSDKNLEKVIDYLGFGKNKYCSIKEMYKIFDHNCIQKEPILSVNSRHQKEGNCFFKEIEAALKYAYSNAYIKSFKTPKWPIDTGLIHANFILNIKKACPNLKDFLSYTNTVYLKNKTFRKICKVAKQSNNNISYQKKEHYFKQIYSTSPDKGLSFLDLQTLRENYSFIYRFCKQHNLDNHTRALDNILPLIEDKVDTKTLVSTLSDCSKVFPNVSRQLSIHYSNYLVQLSDKKTLEGKLIEAKSLLDKALELNPKNAQSYAKRGFYFRKFKMLDNALKDLKHAITLSPNNVRYLSMHASVLLQSNKIELAKSELSKMMSIDKDDTNTIKLQQELDSKCKTLEYTQKL